MPIYALDFETWEEPLTLGAGPAVGNEAPTLDYIPATSIRGAVASALSRAGATAQLARWFGGPFPRWSPAFPITADHNLCVPAPACFVEEKGEPAFGFLNTARMDRLPHQKLPETVKDYRALGALPRGYDDDTHRFQWQKARSQWLETNSNGSFQNMVRVPKATHMHVGLHFERQANRQSALFSRSGIETGDQMLGYRAFVIDPDGAIDTGMAPARLFLGKRRSAGNGAANLDWKEITDLPWHQEANADPLLIQLMSDAIIPAGRGGLLRSLEGDCIGRGWRFFPVASSSEEYPGWSNTWGLPRESAMVIRAGSVFRVETINASEAAAFLVQEGIGVRRNEGFGFVAVNPAWLAERYYPAAGGDGGTLGKRHLWPGFSDEDYEQSGAAESLRGLARTARELASKPGLTQSRLQAVTAYSKRAGSIPEILTFLDQMAERANTRDWDRVRAHLAEPIRTKCRNPQHVWFFLEAASTYARREED